LFYAVLELTEVFLFRYVLEEYCTVRQSVVAQRFIDALAANSSNDKSIKTYSKDIRQYINNMLSWLIDHVPNERKYLAYLLKNCDKLSKNTPMLSLLYFYTILLLI